MLPLFISVLALAAFCLPGWSAGAEQTLAKDGMALILSGSFAPLFRTVEDPKEIQVESFLLDVLPVTNAQFLEFVRANPKWRRSEVKRLFADEDYLKLWRSDLDIGTEAHTNAPVTYVSWFAAKAYAKAQGKRLPSTAEWEYAASASAKRPDGANDPAFVKELRQWCSAPSPAKLPEVGQKPKNYYGVRDLHCLIWEWTSDFSSSMVSGDARAILVWIVSSSAAAVLREPKIPGTFQPSCVTDFAAASKQVTPFTTSVSDVPEALTLHPRRPHKNKSL